MKGSGGASKGGKLVRGLRFSVSSVKAFLHKFRNVTSVKVNATIYFLFNFCFMLPWSALKRIKVQTKASFTKRSNSLITFTSWREMAKRKWPGFYVLCVINECKPSKWTCVSERLLKIDLLKSMSTVGWQQERIWDQLATEDQGTLTSMVPPEVQLVEMEELILPFKFKNLLGEWRWFCLSYRGCSRSYCYRVFWKV